MPSHLRNIAKSLMKGNEAKIQINGKTTKSIPVKKGVFQGSSNSPLQFNISTNHVADALSEPEIS
jgi:Reverse transcriptase (RNA-dependent DNA polymerase)